MNEPHIWDWRSRDEDFWQGAKVPWFARINSCAEAVGYLRMQPQPACACAGLRRSSEDEKLSSNL